MARSTNYKLKCHPPEVAASIRLSWGQLMGAASPTGSCPRCWCLILPSVISVYIREIRWCSHQTLAPPAKCFLHLSPSTHCVSLENSTFISIPTQPLSLFILDFSVFSPPSTMLSPCPASSSGKGLTRPSENSESYIWELITLLWRLPVCRAESETQGGEEEEQVSRE